MTLGTYQVGDLVRLYDLSATLGPWVYRVADFRFSSGKQEALIIDAEGPEAVAAFQWVDTIRLEKVKEGNTNATRTEPTAAATDLGGGPGLRDSGRYIPGSGPAGGGMNAPVIPPDELVRMVAQVRHWQTNVNGDPRTRVPDTDEGFAEAVAKLINFRLDWILRDAKREHELDVAKVREEVARMTATIQERVEGLDRRLSGTQMDIGSSTMKGHVNGLAHRVTMLEEGKGEPFARLRESIRALAQDPRAQKGFLNDGNVVGPYVLDKGTDSQLRELDARIRNLSKAVERLEADEALKIQGRRIDELSALVEAQGHILATRSAREEMVMGLAGVESVTNRVVALSATLQKVEAMVGALTSATNAVAQDHAARIRHLEEAARTTGWRALHNRLALVEASIGERGGGLAQGGE